MYEDEVTIADHLQAAGYATAMYGKWHLGDHYPFRPQDRGFDEVFCMEGGAIGVTADYWNNDYFDDHYLHNGRYVQTKGYNTDVFFAQASSFIKKQVAQNKPFFAYISTARAAQAVDLPAGIRQALSKTLEEPRGLLRHDQQHRR